MSPDQLADLRAIAEQPGPFFTVVLPTPSALDDAGHRFGVEWSNARRELEWPADELDAVDATVSELSHAGGEALVVVHARSGPTHVEFVDQPAVRPTVAQGDAPSLLPLLAARQRTVPHLLVVTDRAGADITAFDGGEVLASEQVDGDTEPIHRGHPGGWSQRRFQQRAENTWERNADDVARTAAALADQVGAAVVLVAGDLRARTMVVDGLDGLGRPATAIEAGDDGGIADEARRLLATHVAEQVTALAEQLKARLGTGSSSIDEDEVLTWLREGRVDTLLVYDDELRGADEPPSTTDEEIAGIPSGNRVADAAVAAALASGADIVVVPRLAVMTGPVAALARW